MPTEEEVKTAEELLGVSRYDEMNTITKKYRQIIKSIHPDKGGIDKQAGKVNAALDAIKDFKKGGVKITNFDSGIKDCTGETFIHPLSRKKAYTPQNNKSVFDDLNDILKNKMNIRQEDINKANVAAKKAVEIAGTSLKQRLMRVGANLLSEYFIKGSKKDFKAVVLTTIKKELKNVKMNLSDELKQGVLTYFNDLFGMELGLEDLAGDSPKKKRRSRKAKKECKIHTIEGSANKLDLKRLVNKGSSKISCSIKSSKGYYINKRLELYYIEQIYKKDTIMVICRDGNNKIYKILAE